MALHVYGSSAIWRMDDIAYEYDKDTYEYEVVDPEYWRGLEYRVTNKRNNNQLHWLTDRTGHICILYMEVASRWFCAQVCDECEHRSSYGNPRQHEIWLFHLYDLGAPVTTLADIISLHLLIS